MGSTKCVLVQWILIHEAAAVLDEKKVFKKFINKDSP